MAKLAQFAEARSEVPPQTGMMAGMAWHGCRSLFKGRRFLHEGRQPRKVRGGPQDVVRHRVIFLGRLDRHTKTIAIGRRVVGNECVYLGRSLRRISFIELSVAKRRGQCVAVDGSAASCKNRRRVLGATLESRLSGCRISSHFSPAGGFYVARRCRGVAAATPPSSGPTIATIGVFSFSGMLHELAISVPAGGGFGLPTMYFALQASAVLLENSSIGKRMLNHSWRGRLFSAVVVAAPAPLLFHPRFVANVIAPFLRAIWPA
jgi:hypothetical protein